MKLQTKIPIVPKEPKIDYDSKIVLLGSCFVENIGEKLEEVKFQTLQNPFGILFHPIAIENIIVRALKKKVFTEKDIFIKNELWYCFEVHSSLNSATKEDFLVQLNYKLKELREYLLKASHIILTYGTAWVYQLIETQKIVANCFKIPQKKFKKELLSIEEINNSFSAITTLINKYNPKTTIITTVSPIRHVKDGMIENNRSKSHLIASVHQLNSEFKQGYYFPSYEIMMDELRDYRFYKEDMIHPNNLAITLIWEAFKNTWVSIESEPYQKEILTIQTGLKHRPFNEGSQEHQLFLKDLKLKINSIKRKIPHIKF